jgi:hypothetical protein
MTFFSIFKGRNLPSNVSNHAYLVDDNWDDWGKYRTLFNLVIFDETGNRIEPGNVKIGEVGLKPSGRVEPGQRAPTLAGEFDVLDERHFSLGQGDTYYEALNQCSVAIRDAVLLGLRDCAFNLGLFESLQTEDVMQQSLLRSVPTENVRARLHRLATGNATLTNFYFKFILSAVEEHSTPLELEYRIEPASNPPTNVHVLIGRNGVGKSRCIQSMARTILNINVPGEPVGAIQQIKEAEPIDVWLVEPDWKFAGLVFVSFSAFDQFSLPDPSTLRTRLEIVGLQKSKQTGSPEPPAAKSPHDLINDFIESFKSCRHGLRAERLRAAISTLGNDPLFADADIASHLDMPDNDWESAARKLFAKLSSGHAIVLLTMTRLVEFVDERTLVLIDEPEGHLHPPLLSAFIRSLADLLIKRNGVAIIATHSPVVLQEVPRSCVWKLRRTGVISTAERPAIETFGENVGVLTREVFGLEVTNAGFHKLLKDAIDVDGLDYDEVLKRFGGQMGAEARAIARALVVDRDTARAGQP